MAKSKRSKGREAENAFREYMQSAMDCQVVHQAESATIKRGPMFITRSNDIWGAIDLLGMGPVWMIAAQVTSSGAGDVAKRRVKLSELPWVRSEVVRPMVVHASKRRDDANPLRKVWVFRIWEAVDAGTRWLDPVAVTMQYQR